MVAFKTANGRTVYDGGGVVPDIKVNEEYYSSLTISLLNRGLIFDYASLYAYEHPDVPDIQGFEISDQDYDEFVTWLDDKEYTYSSHLESSIAALEDVARKEDYLDQIQDEIDLLKAEVAHNRAQDLITFKPELKQLLSEQINGHYHYLKGEIAASLKYDSDVKAALEILNDPMAYNTLLAQKK